VGRESDRLIRRRVRVSKRPEPGTGTAVGRPLERAGQLLEDERVWPELGEVLER
jgi:hypothetical protein